MQQLKEKLREKDPFKDIIGLEKTKRQLSSALMMDHNVIIVGPPGIGKTTLAKNISRLLPDMELLDCDFNCSPDDPICPQCKSNTPKTRKVRGESRFIRIQGSPDLSVEDLLGDIDPIKALKFGPMSLEAFTPGKIFRANNGVLFFDELNRCPEKLQNALLQVLEEGSATLGSYAIDIPANFVFIATMNPEDTSTEKLSDVLLDRFDIIYMSYPDTDEIEKQIVLSKGKQEEVFFDDGLLTLLIRFIRDLRSSDKLQKHPSVRASLSLYERSQANAILRNSAEVTFDDIKDAVISVLSHRIGFKPSIKYMKDPVEFLKEELMGFAKKHRESLGKGGDP